MRLKYRIKREYWYNIYEGKYRAKITLLLPTEEDGDNLHPLLHSARGVCGEVLKPDIGRLDSDNGHNYRMVTMEYGASSPEITQCEVENKINMIHIILREVVQHNYKVMSEMPQDEDTEYGVTYGEEESMWHE